MGRFVKVLATSALAAGTCTPFTFHGVLAQNILPPVTVTGNSGGDTGGGDFQGPGFGGYPGGGGCQSCGGVPEGEFGGSKPAPAPKSPEQKQKDREKCNVARNEARADLLVHHNAAISVCAAHENTTIGYLNEQLKQFIRASWGMGGGNCLVTHTREYNNMLNIIDKRYDACLVAADKG